MVFVTILREWGAVCIFFSVFISILHPGNFDILSHFRLGVPTTRRSMLNSHWLLTFILMLSTGW